MFLRYVSTSISSQMEYRASFFIQIAGQFFITLIDFLGVWVLFGRFGNILGWELYEVMVLYGTVSLSFAINDFVTRGFDIMPRLILSGDLDRFLLRPRPMVLQILGYEFSTRRFGRLAQGLLFLIIGFSGLNLPWNPAKILLFSFTILGGAALFMGLIMIQGAFSFWVPAGLEFMNIFTYGGIETAQFPVTIYHKWFRGFFIFVIPLACISYFPLTEVMGRYDPLGSTMFLRYAAPAAGFLFLGIGTGVWKFGLKYYKSTGS